MTEASTTAPPPALPPSEAPSGPPSLAASGGKHHRSARNYLLDRHFQLKYTGFLLAIVVGLSTMLGVALWNASSEVIDQSRRAVEQGRATVAQGQETVRRGQQVVVLSRKITKVVSMTIARDYQDDPELGKTFADATASDDAKLLDEQKKLEADAERLQAQATDLELQAANVAAQQHTILVALVFVLAVLVVSVGVAGIVFTHKVAGPIFKMKRLLRQVGEGKLVVREKLRKGDELQEFFGTFEEMVQALREHQKAEIAKVDDILARLEGAPLSQDGRRKFDEDGVSLLKKLREEMQSQLEV